MSREFPDFVDPWKAADGRRVFQGTMPLNRMKRLQPLLAQDVPAASGKEGGVTPGPDVAAFSASFGHDEQGVVTIDIEVDAHLPLVCQRSLRPYLQQVRRDSLLAVIEDMAEQDLLPENYEPVWVEHGRPALLDLVEDELLLGIPEVPRNPETDEIELSTDDGFQAASPAEDEETHRPFEGLAGLMKEFED